MKERSLICICIKKTNFTQSFGRFKFSEGGTEDGKEEGAGGGAKGEGEEVEELNIFIKLFRGNLN